MSIVLGMRSDRWRQKRVIGGGLALLTLGYLLYLPIAWRLALPGLLTTAPLLPLALVYLDKSQVDDNVAYRFLFLVAHLFWGLMILIWPAYGGTQWGARYLLPVYPLLLLLAVQVFMTYQKRLPSDWQKLWWATAVIPLVLAFLLQITSIHQLYGVERSQLATRQAIKNLPAQLILTNNPFLPVLMAGIDTDEKWFMYVSDTADLETLILRMADHNVDRFALVTVEGMPLVVPEQVEAIRLQQVGTLTYELQP